MALFKNGRMRKPDKASLRKTLLGDDQYFLRDSDQCKLDNWIYSVNGGALLNRVRFHKGIKIKEIAMIYVDYVRKHYGSSFIVFDGYETAISKSSEHTIPYNQVEFLANEGNKTKLMHLTSQYLVRDDQTVHQCIGDADTMIVSTSLQLARENDVPIVVVADDTDIAVMLLYHWNDQMQTVFFHQEKGKKTWSIKKAFNAIAMVKEHLLFVHAWSGCDTTSSTFGKRKRTFSNMLNKSEELKLESQILSNPLSTQEEVGNAAINTFIVVYGGKKEDSLNAMQ